MRKQRRREAVTGSTSGWTRLKKTKAVTLNKGHEQYDYALYPVTFLVTWGHDHLSLEYKNHKLQEKLKDYESTDKSWITECLLVRSLGGKISWSRKWHTTSVFLPGKYRGPRSLAGYSPWGHKELDMTEQLSTRVYILYIIYMLFILYFIIIKYCFILSNILVNIYQA